MAPFVQTGDRNRVSQSGQGVRELSSLETIGQKLKAARENRGLSLGQIYDRTKIPTTNLEAIELGDAHQLPEPVYVAGFIKRYAECVGLNGQGLAEEFKNHVEDQADNGGGIFSGWSKTSSGNKSRALAVQAVPVASPKIHRVSIEPPKPGFLKTIFYPGFMIVVVVFAMFYMLMWQQTQIDQHDPSLIALRESASRFKTGDTAAPATSGISSTQQTQSPKDARISLTASQHVWVEVKSVKTGESKFTGFLEAGDRRDFQDEEGLKVRAGNGASLNVSFQGKHETFGAAGQRVDRTFMSRGGTEAPEETADSSSSDSSSADSSSTIARPKPKPAPAPRVVKKPEPKAAKPTYRRLTDTPSRYIPGESLGGSRSIGVPYRYTDGRLDSE